MSIVCTLRSPSETRRSRILPADAPGAKGFLSLSIRTATPPPVHPESSRPQGSQAAAPRSPWAPRSGVASRVRRLLPGYVLSLFRQTFSGGLYVQARAAAVDRNTERPARGRRKDGPAVTQGRGGDTGRVAEMGPRFPWPRRAARGPAELAGPARSPRPLPAPTPRPLRPHLSKRTVGKEPCDTQSGPRASPGGFRRERQEHRPRAARGVFRVRGRRDPWHRAGCTGCGLPPSPGLAVGVRALPPASYGPERARQRLSLDPAPLPVNEVTRRPWVVTPG